MSVVVEIQEELLKFIKEGVAYCKEGEKFWFTSKILENKVRNIDGMLYDALYELQLYDVLGMTVTKLNNGERLYTIEWIQEGVQKND